MTNAKIILTADDYGFCDSVDNGIIAAAEKGYISSVAAFANGPNAKTRLDRLKKAQTAIQNKGGILDVGAHFTITSGRPLSESMKDEALGFVDKKGYFRTFTQMKFVEEKEGLNERRAEALLEELSKQLEVYAASNIEVTNLSSHHNALTFTAEYFQLLIQFAIENQIPLRSYDIYPKDKEKKYQLQWRIRLRDNNDAYQIRDIRKFFKSIDTHVNNWQKMPQFNPFPAMPTGINGVNYGPAIPSLFLESIHDEKARKKADETFAAIKKVKDRDIMEFCFHLCDPDIWKKSDLIHHRKEIAKNTPNPNYYPGVTPSYFDCRRMEFLSLELLHNKIGVRTDLPQIISWKNIQ